MKLIKLTLHNYRRFNGTHEINFAHETNKNVTIIHAQNGAGKTGVLMALLFGLFGIVEYQDFRIESDPSNQDILVNRNLLKMGETVTAKVTIEFNEDNDIHVIEREIDARRTNYNKIDQNTNSIRSKLTVNGIVKLSDTEAINDFMNQKIGESVRSFLFFDGVKYMELFNQDHESKRRELKSMIEKMLNINNLDNSIIALKRLNSNYKAKNSKSILEKKKVDFLNKIAHIDEEIASKSDEKDKLKEGIKTFYQEKNEIERRLSENEETRGLLESIEAKEKERDSLIKETEVYHAQNKSEIKNISKKIFSKKLYFDIEDKIKDLLGQNSTFSKAQIEALLNSNSKCICGTSIGEDQKKSLSILLESLEGDDLTEDLKYLLKKINDELNITDKVLKFDTFIKIWNDYINKASRVEQKLNDLKESVSVESNLEELIMKDTKNLGGFESLINEKEKDLDAIETEIEKLNDIKLKEENELSKVNQDIAQENGRLGEFNFYDETRKALEKLREEYIKNAQKAISDKSNIYFKKLLSDEDNQTFSSLKIDDKYRIKAFDYYDNEVFQQLSAGQKHLAAMAFTMGLVSVAMESINKFELPLVMDTPFSNLDKGNRERLIKLLPTVVGQWTLTPMDTELTTNEIQVFNETNSVGNVYRLVKNDKSSEIICLNNVDDLGRY